VIILIGFLAIDPCLEYSRKYAVASEVHTKVTEHATGIIKTFLH